MAGLSYDFSSPFAAARLVLPDGTKIPFWTNSNFSVSSSGGQPPFNLSLAIVTEISVELQLAYLPKITLTLTPPLQDIIDFVDSDLIVWGESFLEVQLGYVGGAANGPVLSPVFTGLLMKPDVSIGADSSITLVGYGIGGFDAVISPGKAEGKKQTRRKHILELLQGPDPSHPRTIQADFSEADKDSSVSAALDTEVVLSPGWKSDWFMVWQLVRECQCWMTQVASKLLIIPKTARLTGVPKFEFAFFPGSVFGPQGQSNVQQDQKALLPILNVSTNSFGALFLPKGASVTGQIMKGVNSETGDAFKIPVADTQATPANTGQASVQPQANPNYTDPNTDTNHGQEPFHSDQPTTVAQQQANAEYAAMRNNMGVKLDVETIGVPELVPGDLVKISGLGKRLSSLEKNQNYGVFTVTHTWNGSGYSTSFTCVSNVGQMFERGKQGAGPVGTQDADPQSADKLTAQSQPGP